MKVFFFFWISNREFIRKRAAKAAPERVDRMYTAGTKRPLEKKQKENKKTHQPPKLRPSQRHQLSNNKTTRDYNQTSPGAQGKKMKI